MSLAPARRQTKPAPPVAAPLSVFVGGEEAVVVPAAAHTLDGFRAWVTADDFPERGRYSFLDGELWIDMSPEEIQTHNKLKMEITSALSALNRKLDLGEVYADGVLVTNEAARLSTEPDCMFVMWGSLQSGTVELAPRKSKEDQYVEVKGTPDWVLEIVSEHTVRKDTKRLRELYFKAGVREYWLVDARGEEIDFQALRRGPDGFEATPAVRGWVASAVFGRRFKLSRKRGTMNFWQYTLHVKK